MSYDAYFYSFEPTGNDAIDMILQAVAAAGKGCHHAEDWREYGLDKDIQDAANNAAAFLSARATPPAPTPAAAEGQAEAINEKRLRELISTLKNAEFDCGEWDGDASDQAPYRAILQRANDATDALVGYVLAAPLPRQAAVQGDSDAKRLDDLETLCWSPNIGNGLVLWAGTKNMEGERKQLYWVQDMGDEDGSNLGDQIGEGVTLRAAIDQAIATMATAPDQAKSAPATTEKEKS